MAVVLNFSLDEEYVEKLEKITKETYIKRSSLLRKWIDQELTLLEGK